MIYELNGRLKSARYIEILKEKNLPYAYANHEVNADDFYFQQDGTPDHRALANINWLEYIRVTLLSWPAVSPDRIHIENIWEVMAQDDYKHGRQFSDLATSESLCSWHLE